MANTPLEMAQADGAHPSLRLDTPTQADVERVWAEYWAPMFREGGLPQIKGEMYDYWHLVNEARKVYRHVTGGMTDTLTASGEGIIALADRRVDDLTQGLRDQIARLEGQVTALRARLGEATPEDGGGMGGG